MMPAAPSCFMRPSAVRFFGVEAGSNGSISTIQPKRLASFGSLVTSKRSCHLPQAYQLPATP